MRATTLFFVLSVVSACWGCQGDDDSGSAGSSGGAGKGKESDAGNSSAGSSSAGNSSAGTSSAGSSSAGNSSAGNSSAGSSSAGNSSAGSSSAGSSSAGSSSAGSSSAGNSSAGSSSAGSGGSSPGSSVDAPEAKNKCYAECDLKANLPNCSPVVSNQECRGLCDFIVNATAAECLDACAAYYDCTVMDGYNCSGTFVTPKSDQCQSAKSAFDECAHVLDGTPCEGQNDNGMCPQVACPCPQGTRMVSGAGNSDGHCKCVDSETCKDLYCD